MSARLREWLAREGVLGEATLRAAVDRQLVYGGGLDTAILERGAMSEATLWARLVAVSGLPAPAPPLCDWSQHAAPPLLPPEVTAPLRTVPVAAEGRTLDMLCAVPVAADAIRAAVREHGYVARLYVVPETRLLAMRQHVYGEPLPARFAPLLAQASGMSRRKPAGFGGLPAGPPRDRADEFSSAREDNPRLPPQLLGDHQRETPGSSNGGAGPLEHFLELSGPLSTNGAGSAGGHSIAELEVEMEVVSSEPAVPDGCAGYGPDSDSDFATATLSLRARDVHDKGRLLALRALRQRLDHPATQALVDELRVAAADVGRAAADTISAIDALGELRDGAAIPTMIDRLATSAASEVAAEIAEAAHRALVAMCAQDFGKSPRRWRTWARDHGARPRVEWLIDGLAHRQAAIRTAAIEELRHLAGDAFGYLPGASKNERDRARLRFMTWWQQLTHPETAISDPISGGVGEQGAFLPPAEDAPLPPTPKAR